MTRPNIHRAVLNDLSDGVLVVGLGGRIETLNPAAELILGLASGEARGRVFAELFITREGLDDFTELVIYATSQQSGTERRAVEVRIAGEARSLSVSTSHLRVARGEGAPEAVAVIAVFSDITELRELRETELRMAREAQTQHERLHPRCVAAASDLATGGCARAPSTPRPTGPCPLKTRSTCRWRIETEA